MQKQVVHADNEVIFSAIKKWAIKPGKDMEGSFSASYKVKEAIWKDCTVGLWLYGILEKQNEGDRDKIRGGTGLGGGSGE